LPAPTAACTPSPDRVWRPPGWDRSWWLAGSDRWLVRIGQLCRSARPCSARRGRAVYYTRCPAGAARTPPRAPKLVSSLSFSPCLCVVLLRGLLLARFDLGRDQSDLVHPG